VLSVEDIQRLIAEAGRDAVERDTLYRRVMRDPRDPARWEPGELLSATCASGR
jgi:aminodeoxyfutalosine synthase